MSGGECPGKNTSSSLPNSEGAPDIFDELRGSLCGQKLGDQYVLSLRRRALFKRTAAAVVASNAVIAGAAIAYLDSPDVYTGVGRLQSIALAHGVEATLGPRTALDFGKSQGDIEISLRKGKIRIADDIRPNGRVVRVSAANGSVTARCNLCVSHRGNTTLISAAGGAAIGQDDGGRPFLIPDQSVIRIDHHGPRMTQSDWETATAWCDGILVVDNSTVGAVIDEIRDYWPGRIFISKRAAATPISGSFFLGDPLKAIYRIKEVGNININDQYIRNSVIIIT